jgi:hypothetical protein
MELIGNNCWRLADSLVRQGKKAEALAYARRAVDILGALNVADVSLARKTLAECDSN